MPPNDQAQRTLLPVRWNRMLTAGCSIGGNYPTGVSSAALHGALLGLPRRVSLAEHRIHRLGNQVISNVVSVREYPRQSFLETLLDAAPRHAGLALTLL